MFAAFVVRTPPKIRRIRRKSRWRSPQSRQKYRRRWVCLTLMVLGSSALLYHHLRFALLQPEAIFVLGGHEEREKFAAQLAQKHPNLDIWVSSGSPPDYVRRIFSKYGISGDRLHLDYQAQDTVTNFTSLVDDFKQQDIESVYLITSENHMQRAALVGNIVFGSQGIDIKPIAVHSHNPPETKLKCIRDGLRAMLWVMTGETGDQWRTSKQISATSPSSDPSPSDKKL